MKAQYNFGSDAGIFLLIIIVLLLAGGIVFAAFMLRTDPVQEILAQDQVISVLYIIEKDQKPLSTFVLMCYPKTRKAAIFDIPNELGTLIRRINRVDRIDTVYDHNDISAYESEVRRLIGIEIAFSIVITTENLGKAVDIIEGVELFIPLKVSIHEENNLVLFNPGVTRLDGDKSIAYIGYTVPDEDREMAIFRRQRFFLSFLKRQAEMIDMLKNRTVVQMYQSFMQTNLNERAKARLLDEFTRIDFERINIQSVGGNLREVSGKMLLIPFFDGNLVKDIVRQVLGTLTSPTEGLYSDRVFTVEILNGTTANGLAGRTADLLRGFGYDIISIGNAVHAGYERTTVIDRSGIDGMARNLAGIIRCNNIDVDTYGGNTDEELSVQSMELTSDFTLILGRDFNGRFVVGN